LPVVNVSESKVNKLKGLLQNLTQLGISFYIVGTREGLSVLTDSGVTMPDPDVLSAATATLVSTADFLSEKYKEGITKEIVVTVEGGYILVFRVGSSYHFAAITKNVTNLEYYLDILRRYAKSIEEVLVSGEEQVVEAEEILRKELELIKFSPEGLGEAGIAEEGQTRQSSNEPRKSKAASPKKRKSG
jgi:predicted regulator of Ras-like GTPase activity (Roadblock/LC7/MglB family)